MNTKILAFAGAKQAGKTTCSNFLHGYQLRAHEIIENFAVSDTGRLIAYTNTIDENGNEKLENTFLDTARKDEQFVEWAIYNMWPFVKKYSFADTLKEIAITMFGLKYEQVYGTEEHKRQVVPHLRWENMPGVYTDEELREAWGQVLDDHLIYKKAGPMTVRDFLQFFGSEICRKMYEPIWVERCIKDIQLEQPLLAIIDDCRFINEVNAVHEAGGKVIGLTRNPYSDNHCSEQVVKEHRESLDAVIDNADKEIGDVCKEIIDTLDEWGWLSEARINHKRKRVQAIKGKKVTE